MSTLFSVKHKIALAEAYINALTATDSNVYIGVGKNAPWANSEYNVPDIYETTNSMNDVINNLIGLKRVTGYNLSLVVPRVDWKAGVTYGAYSSSQNLFDYNSYVQLNGTVTVNVGSNAVTGTTTTFTTQLAPTNQILIYDNPVAPTIKEVIAIGSDTTLTVNSAYSSNFAGNVYNVVSHYPNYASNFYVRNSYDQVFKCIENAGGALSQYMPQLSIDGNLPQNPFILTNDGYKWKYLYTIPPNIKQRFLTDEWMPVLDDLITEKSSIFGRIDIVDVINTGSGYNNNVASSSLSNVITVIGDGTDAVLDAVVNNLGQITAVNVVNSGQNYTYARLVVTDVAGSSGTGANLTAQIGPSGLYPKFLSDNKTIDTTTFYGGHGSRPKFELGATTLMLNMEITSDENGTIPINLDLLGNRFTYRQISLIKDPLMNLSNGDIVLANTINMSATYKLYVGQLAPNETYKYNDTIYQNQTGNTAFLSANDPFTANVVNWTPGVSNILWINNVTGTFVQGVPVTSNSISSTPTAYGLIPPDYVPYSGGILYVNNRTAVTRATDQTEQIKLLLQF
jgi:hypothetical protein